MASGNAGMQRNSRVSTANLASLPSPSAVKNRHLAQLHSQLAQLSAHLADLDNIVRMTAHQAQAMRDLGAWSGGLYALGEYRCYESHRLMLA